MTVTSSSARAIGSPRSTLAPSARSRATALMAVLAALAALAQTLGRELAEADWWRLLDALLLIAAHPASAAEKQGPAR
jgi:hypothetical protein